MTELAGDPRAQRMRFVVIDFEGLTPAGRPPAIVLSRTGRAATPGPLRKSAGQVSALDGLGATAQDSADRLGDALGTDNPADLLSPLAATHPHVVEHHQGLVDQLTAIAEHTDRLRRDAAHQRRTQR